MDLLPVFRKTLKASRTLTSADDKTINETLLMLAGSAISNAGYIISENRKDLALMDESDPLYDRLLLNVERIAGIADDIRNIARMACPTGRILSRTIRPNGLVISRISVSFGVIGVIYEARPNVTYDVFSLCLKSGNACILKGGSDALNSNTAIVTTIKEVLEKSDLDPDIITLLPAGRDEAVQLLNARGFVDLIIPRGSRNLIDFVRENATIPVIETGAGICHTYFDSYGDKEKGRIIVNNAKTRRVSVCNALDCLIIHEERLQDLYYLVELCAESDVIIYGDKKAYSSLKGKYPERLLKIATFESFGNEFLSYKMAVKTVGSLEEAVNHIDEFGSRHSEAIITEDEEQKNKFFRMVDASAVYSNTSTAFTDGAEFGLGAEIGISTQKLHARGPMALEELTTYKWIVEGNGQIRD
ncbi:MAG: glutamate-5-semialdehyde dehydrogenase [Bacteroidales bacterium]